MSIKKDNLYKVVSEEFAASGKPSKNPKFTLHMRVGKFPTPKPDLNLIREKIRSKSLTQNEVAKLAGVKRQVVSDFLRNRLYKKSPAQDKLIRWLYENGFEDCFPKKDRHICVCPDCGAKHRAVLSFRKKNKGDK